MGGVGPIPMCIFQVENRMASANTPSATEGDNVFIDLPLEVDLEALSSKFYMPGRLNIIGW